MSIAETVRAYHGDISDDEHHRYRSWEHCYQFFRQTSPAGILKRREYAALQLGFYLASWGMYRGSSFLLQHAYTVHLGVIDCLAEPQFTLLWQKEFGADDGDLDLIPDVIDAIRAIREAYSPFGEPTDTLVSKVLLGTFGCLPACDRYFRIGFKKRGYQYSCLNEAFIKRVLAICSTNLPELRVEQDRIERTAGVRYPLMKLLDMHFWRIGYENAALEKSRG